MRVITIVPIAKIKVPKNLGMERRVELDRLAESLKEVGQVEAIGCDINNVVMNGVRRVLAARIAGLTEMRVYLTHPPYKGETE